MKKVILAALVALVLGASPVAAQAKSAATFDVLGVLLNIYSGSYETVLPFAENLTGKVDAAYSPNLIWFSNLSYLSLNVEGRYYFSDYLPKGLPTFLYGKPLAGVFAGAGVGFYSVGYKTDSGGSTFEGSYFAPDLKLEVGDKYFFDKHFYLEGALGFDAVFPGSWTWKQDGTKISSWSGYDNNYSVGGLQVDLSLGYAF